MRTNTTISWLLITALVAPHAALGATRTHHATTPQREALPATALGSLWGGEHPLAKIGGDNNWGSLVLRRPNGGCLGSYLAGITPGNSGDMLPASLGVPCPEALPVMYAGEDLVLEIGGDAANLNGNPTPSFDVYVNGVRVPDTDLGPDFMKSCPQIPGDWGHANVAGQGLTLQACSASTTGIQNPNRAVIRNALLNTSFNSVAVVYRMALSTFAASANDVDMRIVFKIGA